MCFASCSLGPIGVAVAPTPVVAVLTLVVAAPRDHGKWPRGVWGENSRDSVARIQHLSSEVDLVSERRDALLLDPGLGLGLDLLDDLLASGGPSLRST